MNLIMEMDHLRKDSPNKPFNPVIPFQTHLWALKLSGASQADTTGLKVVVKYQAPLTSKGERQ